ncbi:MAG TPA: hypothetical protein PKM59_16795, partial [Thermodesulfobacteriota bacterium]|nr:hypothetical protein [Thermodesulfobacteriota bacterium]
TAWRQPMNNEEMPTSLEVGPGASSSFPRRRESRNTIDPTICSLDVLDDSQQNDLFSQLH